MDEYAAFADPVHADDYSKFSDPVDGPVAKPATDPALYDQKDELSKKALRIGREVIRLTGQGLASMAGAPLAPELQPRNASEALGTKLSSALTMAATGVGVGRAMANATGQVVRNVGDVLATSPGSQLVGATAATVAADEVRKQGGSENAQLASSIIAGAVAPGATAGNAIKQAGGRAVSALVDPALQGGRRAIAGRVLNTAANNPSRAVANLENATTHVAGSAPTVGPAAGDAGLAAFEARLRATTPGRFTQRNSQQNNARNILLDSVADGGTAPAIAARTARREQVTTTMRDRAFAQAEGKAVNTPQILAEIDAQLANPDNAGESVQKALTAIRNQIEGKTDARALYAVRKEINRVLEGRYVDANESVLRYAGSQLAAVKTSIDDAISEIAPSWNAYLTKYTQLSRPINRAEKLGEIRERVTVAAPDLETGRDILSQAKWSQIVKRSLPELRETLTRGQITKLEQITADLDRGAAAAAAGRTTGSDTAANLALKGQLSVANILGRTFGTRGKEMSPAMETVMRPLAWLYKIPDESIRELIIDASLDPGLAAQLMKEGTPENIQAVANALRTSARASGIGVAEAQTE